MNPHTKLIAAVVILGATLLAHLFRFEVVPTATGLAYRLDRWTGDVTLLRMNKEERIAGPNVFDDLQVPTFPR